MARIRVEVGEGPNGEQWTLENTHTPPDPDFKVIDQEVDAVRAYEDNGQTS